jgi:TonB family protein
MLSARLPGFSSGRQRVSVSSSMPPLELTAQVGTLKETVTVKSGDADAPGTSVSPRPRPSKPACGSTEVGGNIKPPMKLKDVRPRYKSEWAAANLSGSVLLQAVIGADGRVRNVEVVSPVNADLEDEAINAVSQWEFSPTWLNCEAIEVRMFVTVAFSADR